MVLVLIRPNQQLLVLIRLTTPVDLVNSIILASSGFTVGFVGGMVGLVLGVVRFPSVMNIETSLSTAAGTNLSISTLGAITAGIKHYQQGNVQFRAFVIFAVTGASGAFIGSFLIEYIPVALLVTAIGVIVLYEAFALLRNSRININKNKSVETAASDRSVRNGGILISAKWRLILLESIIGFGIGILGGLVGLILGSIRMPAMISVLRMEPRVAVGTNLAAASVMGISGLIGHIINNNIDYNVLIIMGSTTMVGGYLGPRYTNRFSERRLKQIIGMVLIAIAITMFLRALW